MLLNPRTEAGATEAEMSRRPGDRVQTQRSGAEVGRVLTGRRDETVTGSRNRSTVWSAVSVGRGASRF